MRIWCARLDRFTKLSRPRQSGNTDYTEINPIFNPCDLWLGFFLSHEQTKIGVSPDRNPPRSHFVAARFARVRRNRASEYRAVVRLTLTHRPRRLRRFSDGAGRLQSAAAWFRAPAELTLPGCAKN